MRSRMAPALQTRRQPRCCACASWSTAMTRRRLPLLHPMRRPCRPQQPRRSRRYRLKALSCFSGGAHLRRSELQRPLPAGRACWAEMRTAGAARCASRCHRAASVRRWRLRCARSRCTARLRRCATHASSPPRCAPPQPRRPRQLPPPPPLQHRRSRLRQPQRPRRTSSRRRATLWRGSRSWARCCTTTAAERAPATKPSSTAPPR